VKNLPSEKILETKKKFVKNLSEKLSASCVGVIVNYKGITVEKDTNLRRELRQANVKYFIVKNTLLKIALEQSGILGLEPILKENTALALSESDYVVAAKILCKFAKENDYYQIKAGFIDGHAIDDNKIKELSGLPTKEILISQVLGTLNMPIVGFVSVLNGTVRALAIVLAAIVEKKTA
jgi:large subunit ribosomal protein L10